MKITINDDGTYNILNITADDLADLMSFTRLTATKAESPLIKRDAHILANKIGNALLKAARR